MAEGCLSKKGDFDKAIADLNEAIRLDPKMPRRTTTVACLRQEGRLRQSHRRLHRGDSDQPERWVHILCSGLFVLAERRQSQSRRRFRPSQEARLQGPTKILFRHSLSPTPGGVKPTYLAQPGHTVLNPKLPDDHFEETAKIVQDEFDREKPGRMCLRSGVFFP